MDSRTTRRNRLIWFVSLILVFALAFLFVILPIMPGLGAPLQPGQVASQDYLSPRAFSFESDVLTLQQQENAANQVQPVYTSPDTSIARQQVGHLRDTLAYISAIREDTFATPEQQLADLAALNDIQLRQETAQNILAQSDTRWQAIQQETINVLEQVMRNTIREDRLEEARRSVPTRVSLSLPEDQAAIVAELAAAFVAPNSFYSPELTDEARVQARENVAPVTRTFLPGETIVQRGRVITAADIEALEAAGLIEPGSLWEIEAGALAIVLVTAAFVVLYFSRRPGLLADWRNPLMIGGLFLLFLGSARLLLPNHVVMPYLFPVTAFSLVIAALVGVQPAIFFTLPLVVLITFGLPGALEITLYYLFSAIFGVYTLGQGRRLSSFLRASLTSAIAGIITVLAYRLIGGETDWIGMLTLAGASVFNGAISAALAIFLQFFLAQFLGMTTPLQLMDLVRPDHPLLQFILRRAPGTYQHSLQVANLAEQAAERINADAMLTRVGALYHDAGKALNPTFFIENQMNPGQNPHNDLDPLTSSEIIVRHVSDGLELAHKYRLPRRLQDFIAEHHGTSVTRYQYIKAVEEVGGDESQVDIFQFMYPGPKPSSRETAILMLADSSEAVTRAKAPRDEEEIRALVKSVIEGRLAEGQLDDTNLTIRDLNEILESFTATLKGVYHPRIEYPHLKEKPEAQLTAEAQPDGETKPDEHQPQLSADVHPADVHPADISPEDEHPASILPEGERLEGELPADRTRPMAPNRAASGAAQPSPVLGKWAASDVPTRPVDTGSLPGSPTTAQPDSS